MPARVQKSVDPMCCAQKSLWLLCVVACLMVVGPHWAETLYADDAETAVAEGNETPTDSDASSEPEISQADSSSAPDGEPASTEAAADEPKPDNEQSKAESDQKSGETNSTQKTASADETPSDDKPVEGDSEKQPEAPPEEPEQTVEEERTMEVEPPPAKPKEPEAPPEKTKKDKCIIGATATLIEKQSGLKFRARIDSGAKSCSLHVEKIEIQDASTKENVTERMTENIGKVISFVVKNGDGKTHIIKRKIAGYVIIKTSDKKEGKRRYKVPLTFLWKNMQKEVLVTLNNRQHMDYPLLIGRNFLRGDFLVDVALNSDD